MRQGREQIDWDLIACILALGRFCAQPSELCAHLQEQYRSWFGLGFEFLIHDAMSTYFEGLAAGNTLAARDTRETILRTVSKCVSVWLLPRKAYLRASRSLRAIATT